jgi:hypothetical protein
LFFSSVYSKEIVKSAIQELLNLKSRELPAFIGLLFSENTLVPYLLEKSKVSNETEIKNFVDDFLMRGKNYIYSLTDSSLGKGKEKDGNLNLLLGSSIKRKILETKKDVLVYLEQSQKVYSEFYNNVFKNLSRILSNSTNIAVAKLDISKNDLPDIQISKPFPKLLLFPYDKK